MILPLSVQFWFCLNIAWIILVTGQNYEVAEIDCGIGHGGKELLTARLRRPDGFRGIPIFADDRGVTPPPPISFNGLLPGDYDHGQPCQIHADPQDPSGRVFILKITDFSQCGVLKRDGFINVRIWFPQLPGVVMLSDQEVIIMCKPPQSTVTQSKAAGFAGSIPQGARVSGIVEERPGQLEYEVALFRETSTSTNSGRSVVSSSGAYITGIDSQELPVDQAVPIGTRLQLRAKISPNSAWRHAKLMEVSVSPDPKNANAEGSVALVKNGCRNPELASIIPKQPYRIKDHYNEVVLDFEAFLLSNMGERNTLWLHTQIKACMESMDCESEVCIMDIYQPSSYGKRRRRRGLLSPDTSTVFSSTPHNETAVQYSSPIFKHWKTIEGPDEDLLSKEETSTMKNLLQELQQFKGSQKTEHNDNSQSTNNTKFDNNIGFSVIMPPDYYRSTPANRILSSPYECRGWALTAVISTMILLLTTTSSCLLSYKLRKIKNGKSYFYENAIQETKSGSDMKSCTGTKPHHHHHHHDGPQSGSGCSTKYARDQSIYRP